MKWSDVRHVDVTAREWHYGSTLGRHEAIINYDSALLYNDDDSTFENMLKAGFSNGKLKSAIARTKFPRRWICLVQEFANRGTVQDWLDKELLSPEGMLVVIKQVALALSHMHEKNICHNDIKPENVLLHCDRQVVSVKLCDLGLAEFSEEREADYWQFGMTGVCMVTGEKFGERKFKPERV